MNILFVHNALTSFVRIDRDLLKEQYVVEEFHLKQKTDVNPIQIWKAVKRNQLVFGWFASWHTFLPLLFARLQGKPSILVAGGYDTANVPEARYGNQRKWFARIITNTTIRLATRVICNSQFTKAETAAASGIPPDRITVIYHGLPTPIVAPLPPKENIVLNVGNVSRENLLRKGIKPFLDAAWHLPEYRFVQAGKWIDDAATELLKDLAPNAELLGFVSDEELAALYAKSRFYVQPSLHEGFGVSVVEAMLSECIPVLSKSGALPEVVGNNGVYLTEIQPQEIARQIIQADSANNYDPILISKYALKKYSLSARKESISDLIISII